MLARWKITILSCLLLLLPALVPLEAAEQASADAVLELAISAGNWLIDQGIPQETGTAWPANANKPDQISYDLGSGVAGHVAYLVALYRATGEDRFLKQATEGAHYLAWLLEDESRLDGG